jgi:hypothetical protein
LLAQEFVKNTHRYELARCALTVGELQAGVNV